MINIFKFFLLFTLLVSAESVFAQQTECEKGIEVYQKGDYQGGFIAGLVLIRIFALGTKA